MSDLKIAVVLGSTRPGRKGETVARWILERAAGRNATYELVDLADHPLPLYDEPQTPTRHEYVHEHSREWAATVARYDGYVFVSPEYNHSTSAALKNALDYVNREWNNKAAAIVTYGSAGGHRAAEHLRAILGELQMADVQRQVGLSLVRDFENRTEIRPEERQVALLDGLFEQLEAWAGALKLVREGATTR